MSFISKPLAKLKETEELLHDELKKLWVPWDDKSGSGSVYWHAQAAGALQEAILSVREARNKLAVHDDGEAAPVEDQGVVVSPAPPESQAAPEPPEAPKAAAPPKRVRKPVTKKAPATAAAKKE